MTKRTLSYSGILLLGLVMVSIFLNRGVAQGVANSAAISLATGSSTHILGQTIVFSGTLTFSADETDSISGVTLVNSSGPQAFSVDLPLEDTNGHSLADSDGFVDISTEASITSTVLAKVTFTNVSNTGGTLPSTLASTLPGTLPTVELVSEGNFLAGGSGGTIAYEIKWTPPVGLDPIPDLVLIPNFDAYYDIPTLTPPSEASGTKLPDTDLAWAVPTAGQVSGTELPNVTSTLAIPQITLSTNAPSYAPDLPATTATSTAGFAIPSQTAATSSAATFPLVSDMFAIPTVPVSTSSVANFGAGVTEQFMVPKPLDGSTTTAQIIKGMTHDGTDFWFIIAGASNDVLIKVDVSANYNLSASSTLPSNDFEGIAYSGGSLWIAEAGHRCYDTIENSMSDGGCNYNTRIYKVSGTDLPPNADGGGTTDATWAQTATGATTKVAAIYHFGEEWDNYKGITAGDSGTLWIIDGNGNRFRNINAAGIELSDYEGEWTQSDSLSFNKNLLYTSNGSTLTQWTDQGSKITDFDTGKSAIKANAFDSDVLYFTSNADGKVWATFVGETVNQDQPKGITYSSSGSETALWVVLNASPKDKILKLNDSTGALITNFSTDGIHDAPSSGVEGITYMGGAIYVISNESGGGCCGSNVKLYKINVVSGATESGYPKDLSNFVYDDLGGLTNDGTNLVGWTKTNFNDVKVFSTAGSEVNSYWPCCPSFNGSKGLAYHSGREEYFITSGTSVQQFDSQFNSGNENTLSLSGSGTAFADAQGATFGGDNLYAVSGARVYQSFLAASVTTKPLGIAWSASSVSGMGSSESLWLLIDAAPYDKIMRIDTDDSALNTSFDTDGIADAPSGATEGLVFVSEGNDNYLYIIANDTGGDQWNKQKNLYKYNVKTAAISSGYPKNLENSGVWDELGGITYDGTNLIVTAKTNQGVWIIDTDGQKISEGWPCCSSLFGMTATAYHESRELLYAANQGTLVNVSTDLMQIASEENLTADGSNISGIQGMTFGQDMLYVARHESNTGYVTAGALKESLTTKPQAMVISPSGAIYQGQNIGQALWVVVDGSPKDRVLKLSIATAGTTTLDTNFGSDSTKNGSAALPAGNIKGIAFLDNYLYVVGDSGYDPHLYKLNPTDGSVENTYPLCGGMGPMPGGGGGGGMQVCDSVGGMAQNDTQMIMFGAMSDNVWWVDTSGNVQQDTWLMSTGGSPGASAVGYITSTNSYLSASGSQIQTWMNPFGNDIFPAGNPVTVTGVQNIQALAIKSATKEIYIGWHDGSIGYTSVAVPPSPISNTPLDLAYNANDKELYILVDGNGGDVVVAVNPSTGAILTDSTGAQRYGTVNSEDAFAVAYHDGHIYVAYEERGSGHGGPPPVVASKRSTSTLAEVSLVNLQSQCGQIRGLDSDGVSLLATVQYCGPKVETINPNNGMQIRDIYFWTSGGGGWMDEGFEDVAYSTTTPTYFIIKTGTLWRVDESGEIIDEWSVQDPDGNPTNQLTGIEFVQTSTGQVLYIADANAEKVYTALIPLPTTAITNKPRAMASDGTNLWVAVDADPVDKILQLTANTSSAAVVKSFDSTGTETDGLALLDGELWILNNDTHNIEQPGGGVMQMTISTLSRVSTTTGDELFFSPIIVNTPYGPDILKNLVSGLATDGEKLYTGSNGNRAEIPGRLYVVDPTNFQQLCMFGMCFNAPVAEFANQFAGALPMVNSFQGIEIASAGNFQDDRRLVTAGTSNGPGSPANLISRLDLATFETYQGGGFADSVMYDQKTLLQQSTARGYPLTNPIDVKGIAIVGTTLYMADYANGKLLGTTLAENTGVEMTIIGSYTTALQVIANAGTFTGTSASYSIGRNTTVEVQLTSPGPDFVATGTTATIAGRISDPAVTTVSVGIQLPSTEFISDDVNDTSASQALWTSTTLVGDGSVGWNVKTGAKCPDCGGGAWRFGKPGAYNFDQPNSQVKGALMSNDNVPVNMGTMLSFATAWDTEFQPEMDQKFIQVAQITQDLQGNDVIGTWKNIAQVVQFVDPMWMPDPVNPHELLFQWIEAPPLPFAQGQKHHRTIDLSPLAGDTIKIRFLFNSVDEFANEGAGWFMDDIVVSGSGTKTISVATVMMSSTATTTVGTTTVTMYRSFSTAFTLSEGENTLIATGIQPYSPQLRGQTQVQGFVDTIDPVITLFNVPANTNNPQQQLKGTLVEPTIDKGGMMEISHNVTSPDGSTSTAIVGKVTTEGEFQVFVTLQEGTNTFAAYAEDGGGRNATQTLISVADFSPPVATVGIIGVTSEGEALVGDQYFVVVAATDALSGVSTSTLVSTGQTMVAISQVPAILVQMHSLSHIGNTTSTHATLATVQPNTPVAVQSVAVTVTDRAGNSTVANGSLNVVSSRTNRNYYLFPGNNFMGLAIIPDDDNSGTTDDASMDRLMTQDVSDRVSDGFKTYLDTNTVTLGNVVASTFAFNKAGNFVVHTPGPAADTLTELQPFQGMNINTNEKAGTSTVDVFRKVSVAGFSGQQAVPIRINIEGVFFRLNELPPGKELRVGYNLVAPHILSDTLFDTVYRGALVPRELAVSALTFDRRVAATITSGVISAEIVEGFLTNSIGDTLKPELSYWTFIASDPLDTRVNDLDEPLGPTITP